MKKDVYVDDNYEFKKVKFERPPKFIIDIGANIGWFSYLAAKFHKESTILAYEMCGQNYKKAKVRLEQFKNIKIFNKTVIGDNKAIAMFKHKKNIGGHKALYEGEDSYLAKKLFPIESVIAAGHEVNHNQPDNQTSFQEIIKVNNIDYIDFLKMDCEGCEYELFNQIFKLNLDKKILNFAMELHGGAGATASAQHDMLIEQIKENFDTYKQKGKIIICKNHLNKKEKK